MSGVPILVEATAVRALIVGGGVVAARKAGMLCSAGAHVRVVAPAVGKALRLLADAGRIVLLERSYASGDVGDAELVIAATNDRATNAAVCAEARAAHRLVNVADAADEGSFSTMAVHHVGRLVVGVGAGVPRAASRIRDAIAERFDERYERALESLALLRSELLASGEGARWRTLSQVVIDAEFCSSVDAGTFHDRLGPWRS